MSTPTLVYFEQVLDEVDRDIARIERELLSKKAWRMRVKDELDRRRLRAQQRLAAHDRSGAKSTLVIRRKQQTMTS